jgi:hypothetical protein
MELMRHESRMSHINRGVTSLERITFADEISVASESLKKMGNEKRMSQPCRWHITHERINVKNGTQERNEASSIMRPI